MTAPAVLVMDLGGVTCRWLPDRRLHALVELTGLPASTIEAQVFESGFDDAAERGRFSLDQLVTDLGTVLGLAPGPASTELLRAAWALAFEPEARVLGLIRRSRERARTALFTNNGPLLEAALDHELAQVGSAFDQVVCSWHLGTTKPDPEAFARAAEALGRAPDELLLVDDAVENVAAARAAGWAAHHHRSTLDLQAALADAGLLG